LESQTVNVKRLYVPLFFNTGVLAMIKALSGDESHPRWILLLPRAYARISDTSSRRSVII